MHSITLCQSVWFCFSLYQGVKAQTHFISLQSSHCKTPLNHNKNAIKSKKNIYICFLSHPPALSFSFFLFRYTVFIIVGLIPFILQAFLASLVCHSYIYIYIHIWSWWYFFLAFKYNLESSHFPEIIGTTKMIQTKFNKSGKLTYYCIEAAWLSNYKYRAPS